MIQDIQPYQYDNVYHPALPQAQDFLLCYKGNRTLVKQNGEKIVFPTFQDAEKGWEQERESLYQGAVYLFSIRRPDESGGKETALKEIRFYLHPEVEGRRLEADGFAWEDNWLFRTAKPKYLRFAGITGWQLFRWYESHRFCGRCGVPMVRDEKERMMRCPECGLMEFPKICPAVIIGVTHGNKILMSKYAGRDFKEYALLAGFCEVGETIEETVKREVMEEVGLKVKNITYFKSQPWSFSDTLLMGFFCELDGDGTISIDQEELSMAEWFEREDMPVKEEDLSLTNAMMMAFKEGKI